jgi:hypothetical protein
MTANLIPRAPQRPGRKRTVAARAWISRKVNGGIFYSNVSLGDGRTRTLSTGTRNRPEALEFSLCHLRKILAAAATRQPSRPHPSHRQEHLPI